MSTVRPTVANVARSVTRLDEHADTPESGAKRIDGQEWTRQELRASVADAIGFQWRNHYGGDTFKSRKRVTKRDVAATMAAVGASPFTVSQHSAAIARMIRADVQNGW